MRLHLPGTNTVKSIFFILAFIFCQSSFGQCHESLYKKLENIEEIPYVMVDKFVFDIKTGSTLAIKIDDVAYKTKLGFIFDSPNITDTLYVKLMTLNRKVLTSKKVTPNDYFLRHEPFRKSEYYFLLVETKKTFDSDNAPVTGCLGIAVLERVKKKAFKKLQKIEWVTEK
jgi:hypothetical protein